MEGRIAYKIKELILVLREKYQENKSLNLTGNCFYIKESTGDIKSELNENNDCIEFYIEEKDTNTHIIYNVQENMIIIESSSKEISNHQIVRFLNLELPEEKVDPYHIQIDNFNRIYEGDFVLDKINPCNNISFQIKDSDGYIVLSKVRKENNI